MSDALARKLREPLDQQPRKSEDPDQRVIDALERALKATTPSRPGCPWDEIEEDNEQRKPGFWIPEGS